MIGHKGLERFSKKALNPKGHVSIMFAKGHFLAIKEQIGGLKPSDLSSVHVLGWYFMTMNVSDFQGQSDNRVRTQMG